MKENNLNDIDSFLYNTVKDLSKNLIYNVEKEMDSENVKANLSPKTSSEGLDKNSAKVINTNLD